MTYNPNEMHSDQTERDAFPGVFPKTVRPATIEAGEADDTVLSLPAMTPMAFNTGKAKWVPWYAGAAITYEVSNIDMEDDDTWTLEIGVLGTTDEILKQATNAEIQAELDETFGAGNIVVDGSLDDGPMTFTLKGIFRGEFGTYSFVITSSDGEVDVGDETGGAAADNDEDTIRGFLYPEARVLPNADDEIVGHILLEGNIRFQDIPIPEDEALYDLLSLKKACQEGDLRKRGLIIEGIPSFR